MELPIEDVAKAAICPVPEGSFWDSTIIHVNYGFDSMVAKYGFFGLCWTIAVAMKKRGIWNRIANWFRRVVCRKQTNLKEKKTASHASGETILQLTIQAHQHNVRFPGSFNSKLNELLRRHGRAEVDVGEGWPSEEILK